MAHKATTVVQDRTFLAALQGIDYGEATSSPKTPYVRTKDGLQSTGIFGSPEDYKDLTDEEKRELTEQMKKKVGNLRLGALKEG